MFLLLLSIACTSDKVIPADSADTGDTAPDTDTAIDSADTGACAPELVGLPATIEVSPGVTLSYPLTGCGVPAFDCPLLGGGFDAETLPANLTLYMLASGDQACTFTATVEGADPATVTVQVTASAS